MKSMRPTHIVRAITLSSLTAGLGFLTLPSPSMADREYFYKNCSELQKVMNDYNPGHRFQGFEKAKMIRRNLNTEKYIILCNGGTIVDREEGTICHGYIGYSYARIVAGAEYYSRWGRANGLPNEGDTGKDNYCRWLK